MTQLVTLPQAKEIVIRPGKTVTIRPLAKEDASGLLELFRRVPGYDRFYLKDDVTSKEVIVGWCSHIDLLRVIPYVAETDGEIIGEATLHRRRLPARRHVGEIRVVVDPRYRGRGLGSHLIYHLLEIAYAQQMERVLLELVSEHEEPALRVAREIGFKPAAVLRDHVRDMSGLSHDLVVMELDLKSWYDVDRASNF
ncbi:MAG: N-acetyltransferase [Chloroflexi bacterium]|nr:N-acetyltransferase [Chloroflexota bacterium]